MTAHMKQLPTQVNRWKILGRVAGNTDKVNATCLGCGTSKEVFWQSIRTGDSRSCHSCTPSKSKTHGMTGTKVHFTWTRMLSRCRKPNNPSFNHYGGRGIKVCERWQTFTNFYADMGDPPSQEYSIERINVNGDYEPTNCKWATMKEQQNNRTSNRFIIFRDEKLTISQFSERVGVAPDTMKHRLDSGWSVERAANPRDGRGCR